MARTPKPWFRKHRQVWCVTINGQRHNLGRTKKQAMERFHALMREPRRVQPVASELLVVIVDEFLDWVSVNRSSATYEWYRCRLQSFFDAYPELLTNELKPYHVENGPARQPTRRDTPQPVAGGETLPEVGHVPALR